MQMLWYHSINWWDVEWPDTNPDWNWYNNLWIISQKGTTSFIKQFNFHTWNIESRRSQVSVVNPLLFLLFINDIADDIQSPVRLFADDSSFMNFHFLRTNICLVAFWHILFICSAHLLLLDMATPKCLWLSTWFKFSESR
jgi:hypothetical protein